MNVSRLNIIIYFHNFYIMIKILCCSFLLIFIIHGGPISWKEISSIRVGQLNPVRDLMTQADNTESLTDHSFTFLNQILNVNNSADLQYGISLFSFQSWMTDTFSFNISMLRYDQLGGAIRFIVLDTTFILKAKVHYIIIHRPTGSSPSNNNCNGASCDFNIQAIHGCYVTQRLVDPSTSATNRQQQVGGLQTSLISVGHSDISKLVIFSMITGLKLRNNLGMNNYVKIDTFINNTKLFHKVKVQINNLLVYFCATTIILDPEINQQSYISIIQTYTKELTATNEGLKSFTFMQRYDSQNRTFFGISELNLSMTDVRYINVQTYNVSLIGSLYDVNQALNFMRYHLIFFAERTCSSINYDHYDPKSYDCFANCSQVISSYNTTGTYKGGTSKFCAPCHYSCLNCTSTSCTVCPSNSFRSNTPSGNICNCQTGYVDDNVQICKTCETFLSGCMVCSTKTFCTACDTTKSYILTNIDGSNQICGCQNGSYNASGHCLDYPGCINVTAFDNILACYECDASNNFKYNQTQNECQCMYGYYPNTTLNNMTCSDICGDSVVAVGKCDDGNIQFGDGCDENCNVEDGYDCSSTNTTSGGSLCFLKDTIVISYLYAEKKSESNKYKMVFSFSPAKTGMNSNSFKGKISTSLATYNEKLTFDTASNLIIFENDYQNDIEGTSQHMNISFINMSFFADPMTVYFTPVGINAQLVIDKNQSIQSILSIVLTICILLAVLIAIFASIVSLKMVGIELLIPIQIIYFSLATVQNHRSATSSLQNLKYSSGFNVIVPYTYSRSYSQHKNLVGMGFETQFLLNSNIFLVIYFIILLWLLFNHLKLRYKEYKLQQFLQKNDLNDKKRDKQDEDSQQEKEKESSQEQQILKKKKVVDEEVQYMQSKLREDNHRTLKLFGFYVDRIYFIFFTILMNQVFFSFFIMALGMPISSFIFSRQLYAVSLNITYFIFIGNLVFIHTDQQTSKMIVFNCINDRYVYYYYAIDFLIIIVLAISFEQVFSIYIVTVLSFIYIILIIVQKPYSSIFLSLQNIIALYLHIMMFICLIFVCLIGTNSKLTEAQAVLYTIFIIGLIVVGEILTVIRLILKVNFKKAFESLKNHSNALQSNKKQNKIIKKNLDLLQQQDKNLQIIPSDEVKNGLFTPKDRMIDWESKNSSDYHSYRNKQAQHNTNEKTNELQEQNQQNNETQSQNDRKINELDILKKKLRNNLKMKQESQGKSKIN